MTVDQPRIAGIDTAWTAEDEAALEGAFTDRIVIEVFGLPQAQGSKTAFHHKQSGKVVMTEGKTTAGREKFKSWRDGVAQAASDWQREHHRPLIDEACTVTIEFRLLRPPSAPRKRLRPETGLDLDKMCRAVFDSLTGVILKNDARVCTLSATKVFATEDRLPGCTITVEVDDASA